jgi:hypothetical protein
MFNLMFNSRCPICREELKLGVVTVPTGGGILDIPGLVCPNNHYSHFVAGGVFRITVEDKHFQVVRSDPHVLMAIREKEIDRSVFNARRKWLAKSEVVRLE